MTPLGKSIVDALKEHGPLTAENIAEIIGSNTSSVFASLSSMSNRETSPVVHVRSRKSKWKLTKYGADTASNSVVPQTITDAIEEHRFLERLVFNAERRIDTLVHEAACAALGCDLEPADFSWTRAWDCPGPINICVYDLSQDPCEDDCLFCHEPRERK